MKVLKEMQGEYSEKDNINLKLIFKQVLNVLIDYLDQNALDKLPGSSEEEKWTPTFFMDSLKSENHMIKKQRKRKKKVTQSLKNVQLNNQDFLLKNKIINNDIIQNKNEHFLISNMTKPMVSEELHHLHFEGDLEEEERSVHFEQKKLTKHISRHLYPEFLLVQPEDIELNLSQDV
jgi:hypothetical protein